MKRHRRIIYIAGFIFSVPIALTSYINSSFLEAYTNSFYVSATYIVASLLSIFGMLLMPSILSRLGNRLTTLILGIFTLISFLMLALGETVFIILPAFVLYFFATNFILATLDVFMEDFSGRGSIGKFRGFYLTIIHLGWVTAQLASGSVISETSFEGLYLLAAIFISVFCLIFFLSLHDFKDPEYKKVPVRKTLRIFINNKHLSKIYTINLILKFFYAWMVIYTPIYLSQYVGFAWNEMGIIFSIMLLPFVFLTFPLGRLSDTMGEKKMLLIGFIIASLSTLIIPFIEAKEIWIWGLILAATRIGAATIEIMSESYFFKYINEENADAISFFRNTTPVAYIVAPVIAIAVLYLVPSFEYLFFVLGAILFVGFYITLRLRDVK